MKKTILTVLLVAAATAQARFSESHIPLSSGTDANLQNNTIYDVNSDLTLSAAAGSSKFRVLGSNVVAINIKKGVTLTLKGGDATGSIGAGAAISVAPNATLYLMGEGTLIATGGAAGNGCGGSSGGSGSIEVSNNRGKGGSGGTGGAGGGGGAPAIGGVGGDGGAGGGGGSGSYKTCSRGDFAGDGGSGSDGASGSSGGGMGRVVILGNLTVRATAGAIATSDGSAGSSGSKGTDAGSGWTNNYAAGGGGGGGGGARGQNAEYGIGGGGAGGAGGGGGGAGGTLCNSASGYDTAWGAGGKGGKSYTGSSGSTGNKGGDQTKTLYYGTANGGGGGAGGAANTTRGDNGTLEIGPSVKFTSSPSRASNTPLKLAESGLYTTHLNFYSQGAKVGEDTAQLMLKMPETPPALTRNGYRFLGYFTVAEGESGGRCIYGPDYAPASPVWESVEASVDLYAHWEVAPTMLVVNTNEDGENLGQGKVTLRDAMRALCADAMLCGTSGLRRIEFDLPAEDGKNVITLTNVIAVSSGTSPIAIDGFNGGNGVTITAGGNYSALQLTGSDVHLRCLNFRSCPAPAIAHSGGLTVEDCSFIANRGAIQSGKDAKLEALNCTFADNAAASAGGAVNMANTSAYGAFINCTFARNSASVGSAVTSLKAPLVFIHCTLVPGGANELVSASGIDTYFLNTLIAKPSGGTAVTAGKTTSICSSLGTQDQSAILNPAQADDLLGVRQIWYEPVQSSASGNRDAALVLYDYKLDNIAIVTNGVKTALGDGNAGLATMPIGIDQLHGARMAPVRGSIRIATGVQPPVVNVEGVAWGQANAVVTATATVIYDDETIVQNIPVTVKTNPDAVFGTAVEVDGSDLYTHNVTEVRLNGLAGDHNMIVATSPYALVASSASAIATEDSEVYLPGDEIRVTSALADSLVVSDLTVGGEAFSAGGLAGFQDITLDDVNVRGGSLRLLGSTSKNGGAEMANLSNKSIGGGENGVENDTSGSLKDDSKSWTAKYDGFVQVRVEANNTSSGKVGLKVGSVEVTPLAAIGTGGSRTPVWTVPVRANEKVTLEARGISIGYMVQFIYFGVKE